MYLEPIFASEDINRQLPVESRKFNTVQRNLERIMGNARDCPNVCNTNFILIFILIFYAHLPFCKCVRVSIILNKISIYLISKKYVTSIIFN